MSQRTATPNKAVEQSHRQLRTLVREVGALCRQPLADDAFYPAYLRRIVAGLDASGAAIWTIGRDGQAIRRWQQNSPRSTSPAPAAADRQRLIQRACKSRGGLIFRPAAGKSQSPPTCAIYVPQRRGSEISAVIEVFKASADEHVVRNWLKFVTHMALLASERPSRPTAIAPRPALSAKQLIDFIRTVHESLDRERASYNIANELRRFLACDRVSLIRVDGGRGQMLAISGQDSFDRRADVVRRLTALAQSSSHASEPQWFERRASAAADSPHALPPGAEEISRWQTLGIVPLRPTHADRPIGVVIIEQMEAGATHCELVRRTQLALPHAAGALQNALEHSAIPLLSLLHIYRRSVRADGASWQRRAIILAAIAAVVFFLALFPVPFQMHASGTLQPSVERDVFAEVAGTIRLVHVEHGDFVQAGDVLAELHNSDVEVQSAQITGEQRAARERLAAVQRQRHDPRTPRTEYDHLASEALQLQEHLRGLDEQLSLLQAKRERLIVRSPIAGQVVTWNVRKLLDQRPVTVGQVLLTVADPESPRKLEIFLPESDIAHLTHAQNTAQQPLPVEYLVVTEPTVTYRGALRHIDSRAQLHDEHDHSVRLLVDIHSGEAPSAPAGTTVNARIACGQRSIGYVWLHRLVGFVYTRILFHVG